MTLQFAVSLAYASGYGPSDRTLILSCDKALVRRGAISSAILHGWQSASETDGRQQLMWCLPVRAALDLRPDSLRIAMLSNRVAASSSNEA